MLSLLSRKLLTSVSVTSLDMHGIACLYDFQCKSKTFTVDINIETRVDILSMAAVRKRINPDRCNGYEKCSLL